MRLFVFSLLLLVTFTTYAQQVKKQDIILLMKLIKIEPTINNMIEQGIAYYQKQKPNVPPHVWIEIKNHISYTSYLLKVEQIFDSNYSQDEIQRLITEANANQKKLPLFKQIVQQQLYDAGKQFGNWYGNYIKETLEQKGY